MPVVDRPPGDLLTLAREPISGTRLSAIPRPGIAWKSRILLPGSIILALLLLIGYSARDLILPAREVRAIAVVVKSGGVESGASFTVQAPGWVEADPYPISVSALTDGIIKEVLALEGQTIHAGDVVARMIDEDANLALARAKSDLLDKQSRLEAAKANWDNPIERTRAVATNEAMVAETKAELEKLTADVAVESARLIAVKVEAERTAESFKTRASSEIETIRAQQLYEAQKSLVEATKARRPILDAQLAQRNADLTAARDNLRLRIEETQALAEAEARVALATAARDEAALRLVRMEVRSPATGIVMERLAVPGGKLMLNMDNPHSAQVVRLYDPTRLQVRVDIPIADAAKVGVGQAAKIVVAVAPDFAFDGKVTRIVHEADIQKNTLQVKVAITNPSPDLKPEMLARVRIATGGATTRSINGQTVFAPREVIHATGGEATVWTVDPRHNVAVRKTITLGDAQQDGWIAVTSGLSPGDQIIAAGANELSDGQRIRVVGEPSITGANPKGGDHGTH
ncbi:HlyD family efflux transporter periplasmic adaptor subunit [soil metagenome]